ncbi:MAG: aa3-type cytochrome c oxidase subunit IV [Beijerinckiaceae bacterium]
MANIDTAPEWTDREEYAVHLRNYHRFVRLLWWNVAGIAVVLALMAMFLT